MFFRGAALGVGGLGALVFVVLAGCGSSKRAGNGGECFVAADCQEPLVCVEQKDKTRRCTENIDSIVGEVPPEAGPPKPDAGEVEGGTDGGGPTSEPDAGQPEPKDSGSTDQ
jgi:hypothetical protein